MSTRQEIERDVLRRAWHELVQFARRELGDADFDGLDGLTYAGQLDDGRVFVCLGGGRIFSYVDSQPAELEGELVVPQLN